MAVRHIIEIDEELCDGCGLCVPSCAEGALQVIDGKARLVADVLCDGLGACLGECPTGALTVITREAGDFDEAAAAAHVAALQVPPAAAPTHHRVSTPVTAASPQRPHASVEPRVHAHTGGGCPGSRVQVFDRASLATHAGAVATAPATSSSSSALRQWPVQLHLVPPVAPFFQDRDVLLAADCVPVAVGDFHASFLDGRGLAIACPKLDQQLEAYVEKLAAMIDHARIRSLTVAVMEVPCCGGLVRMALQARQRATRPVPIRVVTISTRGQVLDARQA